MSEKKIIRPFLEKKNMTRNLQRLKPSYAVRHFHDKCFFIVKLCRVSSGRKIPEKSGKVKEFMAPWKSQRIHKINQETLRVALSRREWT